MASSSMKKNATYIQLYWNLQTMYRIFLLLKCCEKSCYILMSKNTVKNYKYNVHQTVLFTIQSQKNRQSLDLHDALPY